MPPKRASSSIVQQCLFCAEKCSSQKNRSRNWFSSESPGSQGCNELQKQLQNIFVLRNILDVSKTWCEEALTKYNDVEPSSWFQICGNCFPLVDRAWTMHQESLQIQSRIKSVKEKIRRKIVGSSSRVAGGRGSNPNNEFDLYEKIRSLFAITVKEEIIIADPDPDYDEAFQFEDLVENDSDNDNDDDFRPDVDVNLDICDNKAELNADDVEGNTSDSLDDGESLEKTTSTRKRKKKRVSKSGRNRPPRKKEPPRKRKRIRVSKTGRTRKNYDWICDTCPEKYATVEELETHKEAHERSRLNNFEFECSECNFPAENKPSLDYHMEKKHASYFVCKVPDCGYRNRQYYKFESHARLMHPDKSLEDCGVESLECSECHQKLQNSTALLIHQRSMHPELFPGQQDVLQCDQCSLLFTSQMFLEFHINNTHKRVMNVFCDICGKGFPRKKNLTRHLTTHQSTKEFVCHLCGCDYFYKSDLNEHYRKIHPDKDVSTSGENQPADSREGAAEKEFKCRFCDLTSPFKLVIHRHEKVHKPEKGQVCDECGKCYTSSGGLRRHKILNHSKVPQNATCPHCLKSFSHWLYMKDHLARYCKVKNMDDKLEKQLEQQSQQLLQLPTDSEANL